MPIIRPGHPWNRLFVSATRMVFSFLVAGLFNFIWLAAFLALTGKPPGGPVSWLLWCLAPPVTASGFSVGIILFDLHVLKTRISLLSVLPYPLTGCVIGAAAIIPVGKMFIGIGMFTVGGIAVLLRELRLARQK